jgi:dihydrodipicolinate reductase
MTTHQFELTHEEYQNHIFKIGYINVVNNILELKNKHVYYDTLGDIYIYI